MDMEFLYYAEVPEDRRKSSSIHRLLMGIVITLLAVLLSSCAPFNPYQQCSCQQSGQTYARPEQVQLRESSRTLEEAQRFVRDLDLLKYEIDNLRDRF